MNRHGLIAGATGTGKTRTLQLIAEQLSDAGVSVFAADYKGDLSGLADPGAADGPAPKRMADLGLPYQPTAYPVEFLSLGGIGDGVPVRATDHRLRAGVARQGARRERDAGAVARPALPLRRRARARASSTWPTCARCSRISALGAGKADLTGIGGVANADDRRAAAFARPARGRRRHAVLRRAAVRDRRPHPHGAGRPRYHHVASSSRRSRTSRQLFSTVLMWVLAELFEQLPEVGDLEKPKLVFFFDEAHLLFDGATKSFLDSVERTVRMIRSKGVGVFFVTQQPTDLPAQVLGQLGARVQHALRAFTPRGRGRAEEDGPHVSDLRVLRPRQALTQVGTGEAVVTILSEKGVPTPVVHTRLRAPRSSMTASSERRRRGEGLSALREVRDAAREGQRRRGARAAAPRPRRRRTGGGRPTAAPSGEEGEARRERAHRLPRLAAGQDAAARVVRGAFSLLKKRM